MLWKKRFLSLLAACSTVLMAACGELPEHYPGVEEDPVVYEMGDRFKVDFFYQNNENTFCIRPDAVAKKFFEALTQTFSVMSYSDASKTYVLDYDSGYEIVEYDRTQCANLTWENARNEYGSKGDKNTNPESFYVLNGKNGVEHIAGNERFDGGILRLFVDEVKRQDVCGFSSLIQAEEVTGESTETSETVMSESQTTLEKGESFFDPDAINVIFTDLSERDITYLGEDLRNYYIADNRYNACVLAIKLEMESNQPIYYASKDTNNSLTSNRSGNNRWFYLLMMGPSTDLAIFVQKLTANLESQNIKEGTDVGGYQLSDLSFTSENFDITKDIVVSELSASNEEQQIVYSEQGADALFENSLVRLDRIEGKDSVFPVGIFRDNIIEYRYHNSENEYGLSGYQGTNTDDFALNIDLIKEVDERDQVAESTKLSYVLGEPVVYEPSGVEWVKMDGDHQERFFKKIAIDENDGKHLTIISDNADECGVHNIYITVPVLQKATVSQVISEQEDSTTAWVINECTVKGSDPAEEVKRTYYFDKFYSSLFDLRIEDDRDGKNNPYEEEKDVYAQIDEIRILIEDIH